MSKTVKNFLYWVSILPPIYKAVCGVINYVYKAYMNTLMEIDTKKQEELFEKSFTYTKGVKND